MLRRLYSALAVPLVYRICGYLMVPPAGRATLAREHIRAKDGQRLLDIGCGPADLFPHLPRVDYTGFDVNPAYIETATRNYGSERARFYCKRVSDETLAEHSEFDVVLGIAILHHLDDAESEHLFRLAWSALKPGGRLVTLDCALTPDQSRIARFLVSRDRGEHVREPRGYTSIAERVFPSVKATVREDLMRVPYTHVILECEKPAG
jgi:SAM-dependent methyltransferase